MPRNLENPGRPSSPVNGGMQAERQPYVEWTPDYHPWMEDALCTPWTADEWFEGPPSIAVAVCKQCPVRWPCLERALRQEEIPHVWGVAGGLTAEERRELKRRGAA